MSTKSGSLSIVCIQLGPRKLSIIRSSGVSAIQGLLSNEVNGRTVGTFRIVRYIVGVCCEGCPLSGVPLYCLCDSEYTDVTVL